MPLLTSKTTQTHSRFSVNSSIICNFSALLTSLVQYGKILPNLVNSSWLWWIMHVILANQKPRNTLNNDYLTFLFITLKVQDMHCLFSQSIPFIFFAVLFFEMPTWPQFLESRLNYPPISVKSMINFLIPWITNCGLKRSSWKRNKPTIN